MDSLTNTTHSRPTLPQARAEPNANKLLPLTFGVEFEFAVATAFEAETNPTADSSLPPAIIIPAGDNDTIFTKDELDDIAHRTIADSLQQAGLPAQGHKPNLEHVRSRCPWTGGTEDMPYTPYGPSWVVTGDSTIRGPDNQYRWTQTELQSPPYMYSPAALEAVKMACEVLTTQFRCNVNASTGLHVHVGNGADGFSFEVVRQLMLFLWTFEPQLDQLHAVERVDGDWFPSLRGQSNLAFDNRRVEAAPPSGEELCFGSTMSCEPDAMSEEAHQASAWDAIKLSPPPSARALVMRGIGVVEGIQRIWKEDSIDGLHALLRCASGCKSKYNLFFLTQHNRHPTHRTVEFRQHAGTLDGDVAAAWIRTVVGLVAFARAHAGPHLAPRLVGFCLRHASVEDAGGPVADVVDLLKAVGLVDEARFWASRLPRRRPPTRYGVAMEQTGNSM